MMMDDMSKNKTKPVGNPRTPAPLWGYVLSGGLMLVFIGIGAVLAFAAYLENENTEPADGVVVGFYEQVDRPDDKGRGGGISYGPIVEYAVGDKKYRCRSSAVCGSNMWTLGEHMAVRYHPDAPDKAFIDSFFSRWLTPLGLMGFGGFFLFFICAASFSSSQPPPRNPTFQQWRMTLSKNPYIWWWQFIAGQVFCMGFLLPGLALVITGSRLDFDTATVTGKVIANHDRLVNGTKYYRPIVEYQVDGQEYVCRHLDWSQSKHSVGSSLAIRYRTDHPEGVINSSG
jgi:hypothetical protein